MGKTSNTDLNDKQERFCREYVKDLNGTQAAIRAGYSTKTAREQASQLLTKLHIQARVKELQAKVVNKLEITSEMILQEILLLARCDLSKAYDSSGNLLPIHEIPEDVRRAMSAYEPTEYGRKAKFYDKTRALELLGKHLKLFTDQIDHKHRVTLGELIDESMKEENDE
jgi:phage terminase small subunit